jgi:quaternary ammonium compound-resistance protein SugE
MAWLVLFVAGLLEIGWAIGLKYTESFTRLVPSVLTLGAMAGSIVLLGLALKTLPIGPGSAPLEQLFSESRCSANPQPRPASPASG